MSGATDNALDTSVVGAFQAEKIDEVAPEKVKKMIPLCWNFLSWLFASRARYILILLVRCY